jgi:hypothetical protein
MNVKSTHDFNVKEETHTELLFPDGTRELLGPAPVVFGESKDNYERLLARFAADVGPTDFIEWVLIKEIADCTWEIQRLLRFEIEVVRRGIARAARDKLSHLMPVFFEPDERKSGGELEHIAQGASLGAPGSDVVLDTLLKQTGLSGEKISAESYIAQLWAIRPLQQIRAIADGKRERMLRLIERRRVAFGSRLRRTSDAAVTDLKAELSE